MLNDGSSNCSLFCWKHVVQTEKKLIFTASTLVFDEHSWKVSCLPSPGNDSPWFMVLSREPALRWGGNFTITFGNGASVNASYAIILSKEGDFSIAPVNATITFLNSKLTPLSTLSLHYDNSPLQTRFLTPKFFTDTLKLFLSPPPHLVDIWYDIISSICMDVNC